MNIFLIRCCLSYELKTILLHHIWEAHLLLIRHWERRRLHLIGTFPAILGNLWSRGWLISFWWLNLRFKSLTHKLINLSLKMFCTASNVGLSLLAMRTVFRFMCQCMAFCTCYARIRRGLIEEGHHGWIRPSPWVARQPLHCLENCLHFSGSAILTVSDALELQEASEQLFWLNMRIPIAVSLKLLYFVLLCINYLKEEEIRKCWVV